MEKTWELGFSCIYNDYSDSWLSGEQPEGFSYVELSAGGHPIEDEAVKAQTVARYEAEYKMAAAQGLKLWSVHLPYGPKLDLNAEDQSDEIFGNFAYYVNAVMEMKPRYFVVHLWTAEPYEPADREAAVKTTNGNIRRLAEYIAAKGATLAVEVLPRTNMGNTVQECMKLIDGTKAELCFDVNHLMQGTHREFMETAGVRVKTLHLSDYEFGDEKHWIPGEGKIDWKELLQLLVQHGYEGPLMFEVTRRKDGGKLSLRDIREGFYRAIE